MSWSNRYTGIPFADLGRDRSGADCWGLACIVYRDELGVSLPEYTGYASAFEQAEVTALVAGAQTSPIWQLTWTEAPFDVLLFRRGALSSHLGLVIKPGLMLHMAAGDCAKVEDYSTGRWRNRLVGAYRWVGTP